MNQGHVTVRHEGAVAHIEFYHPLSNSLPGHVLASLADAIDAEGDNPNTTVMVLRGAGDRAFCGGASFDELVAIDNEAEGLAFFSGFANVINAIRKSPKLVIGRVHGKAVGGGVGLASATDYCFATKFAAIKLSELAVGIGPFVVGPAVERKVGVSGMSQLAIDATEFRSAQWAQDMGLYAEVFDDVDAMDAGIQRLTDKLCGQSVAAQRELKRIFWEGTEHWDSLLKERAAISGSLVLTPEAKAAIQKIKAALSK